MHPERGTYMLFFFFLLSLSFSESVHSQSLCGAFQVKSRGHTLMNRPTHPWKDSHRGRGCGLSHLFFVGQFSSVEGDILLRCAPTDTEQCHSPRAAALVWLNEINLHYT
tara:strand:- start:826 stop:1152 length:327 start_codon:yes stop_codon:yes gene_type:complete